MSDRAGQGDEADHARAGDAIDTSSEAHRAACEARWLARLPSDLARSDYLALVATRRGQPAADALRRAAWAILKPRSP